MEIWCYAVPGAVGTKALTFYTFGFISGHEKSLKFLLLILH